MKQSFASCTVTVAATLLTCAVALADNKTKGDAAAKPPPVTPPAPVVTEIVKSTFNVAATPQEGRNPFFPNSTAVKPAPQQPVAPPGPAVEPPSSFVLNGITSPPRRTAMINGRTFEPGEEGEIRLPSGSKVLIKCLEIKDDAAIILAGGIRRELRMRFAL